MNLKEAVKKELGTIPYKLKYYKQSPYMKNRYKPEFIQQEVWIYTNISQYGYLITEEDFNNKEYRKNFFDMIREENKNTN